MVHPASISRIDLVTSAQIPMPHTLNDSVVLIEDEEVFRLRAKAATSAFRDGVAPGEHYQGYLHFELSGGHRLMFELQRLLQNQIQFFTNLNRMLEIPTMVFPHPRGGAIFVNVANVVSINAAPGFSGYPKGAWLVESN